MNSPVHWIIDRPVCIVQAQISHADDWLERARSPAHNGEPKEAFMAMNKRDQLIEKAQELFYREGYHATGIDRILAESGVAKMTMYKHFKSKEELILAVLDARHEIMIQRLRERASKLTPREALLAMFDGLHSMIHSRDQFCGCLFVNAAAEYQDREHPIHRRSCTYK